MTVVARRRVRLNNSVHPDVLDPPPRVISSMSVDFDPYHEWLGIPKADQPPDHYRLLGLARFEGNRQTIAHAYDQRMVHIRNLQIGPNAPQAQKILNELSRAFTCLLNSRRKALYDQHLRTAANAAQIAAAYQPPELPESIKVSQAASGRPPQHVKILSERRQNALSRTALKTTRKKWILLGAACFAGFLVAGGYMAVVQQTLFNGNRSTQSDGSLASNPGQTSSIEDSTSPTSAGNTADRTDNPVFNRDGNRESQGSDGQGFPGTGSAGISGPESPTSPVNNSEVNLGAKSSGPDSANGNSPETVVGASPATPTGSAKPTNSPAESLAAMPSEPRGTAVRPKFALRMNGSGGIAISQTAGLIDVRRSFTVEFWVRFAAGADAHWLTGDMVFGPNHPEVSGNNPAGWQTWIMTTSAGKHRIAAATGKGFFGEFLVRENEWRHLAVCGDAEQITLFVDGRRAQSHSLGLFLENWKPSPIDLHFGGHVYLHPTQPSAFRGDIKGYRVSSMCRYRENFSPAEILELDSATALWLDFSRNSGMTVTDLSGFARHGVITGAVWVDLSEESAAVVATTVVAEPIPPIRKPVPSDEELETARTSVLEIFKEDRAKASDDPHRESLARKLRNLAQENSENSANQFVLLDEARMLAAAAGNITLASEIIDEAVRYFDKDEWKWKVDTIRKTAELAKSVEARKRVAAAVLDQVDLAALAGDFDVASEIIQIGSSVSARARDPESVKATKERREELTLQRRRWSLAHDAKRILESAPDHARRNEEWGLFLAVQQEDWNQALPFLSRAETKEIRAAAALDVQQPTESERQVSAGNLWFDAAQVAEKRDRTALLERSLQWYRRAEPASKGLGRVHVEKRIQELVAAASLESKKPGKGKKSASLPESVDVPPGLRGLLGRIQVEGRDAGILWRYESGLNITDSTINDVLSRVGVPAGKLQMEFVGILFVPENARVGVRVIGGSTKTGTGVLFVNGKKVAEVGAAKDARDQSETVSLSPGEHAVRWVLAGTEIGRSSLSITDLRSGKPLSIYHTPQMAMVAREQPFRPKLNVEMSKTP